MNENMKQVIRHVQMQIADAESINENDIKKFVDAFSIFNPVNESEKEAIIKELHYLLPIKMDRGNCLKEKKHVSWYFGEQKNINPEYWERFRMHLLRNENFSNSVVDTLDATTDEIMDLLGNPKSLEGFSRKGLVIGDVQSGKTSTYTALINKAADAGYRVVILLTGTIEKLREQTQKRLDAGFVGLDSNAFIKDKNKIFCGVGDFNGNISGWSITSTTSDFNTKAANQFVGRLSGITDPVLFVLKKNKSVLEQLERWLRVFNAENDVISTPMLLIDDEADNASVNTRKDEDNPTAINACIRKLLKLFTKSNYVAFTATPFANIFINPDSDHEMLDDDLFPRHFIYALEPPTNYIGARNIFSNQGEYNYMLKNNDDCEEYLPEGHKKDFVPSGLPVSLKVAIASFFISNTIRDLRGSYNSHRTMLINISRFINVQEKVLIEIDSYVRNLKRVVRNYSHMGNEAMNHKEIVFIKEVYNNHYKNLTDRDLQGEDRFSWDEILYALNDAIAPIIIRTVNGGNAQKNLNYDEYEKTGLRLIAIGGYSLSRGLTLEGLMISYFYRNSKMYDTLMQMGRWFGYRPHYADLCRIWMSDQSTSWYEFISEASDELKQQVKKMMNLNLTPEDFGLGVRKDCNALFVTAVNKMRYTKDIQQVMSLNGTVVETPYLSLLPELNNKNYEVIEQWINSLFDNGYKIANNSNLALDKPQFLNVSSEYIIELLQNFTSHSYNLKFRPESIIDSIKNDKDAILKSWDVVIATGNCSDSYNIGNLKNINPVSRSFTVNEKINAIQVSGSKLRLGAVNFAKGGLTKEKSLIIEREALKSRTSNKGKSLNQDEYFNSGEIRNPLLIIYPVKLIANFKNNDTGKEEIDHDKQKIIDKNPLLLMGLAVGVPSIKGNKPITFNYTINLVKCREIFGVDENYLEETGIEDDIK
ncbi:MAG: Z1 domain-containing protein [Bacilli bacterium]